MEVRRKMGNFDRIIGYEDIKAELIRFADVIRNTEKYSRIGVTLPSGLLIYGDPGLGKSLMAKCFIEEAGCKTYTIRKEKPNGDFVKEIKEVFDYSDAGGAPILGLKGAVLKIHGNSKATEVYYAIHRAIDYVDSNITGMIAEAIGNSEELADKGEE